VNHPPTLRLLDDICRELRRGLLAHRQDEERRRGEASLLEDVQRLQEAMIHVLEGGSPSAPVLPMSMRPLADRTRKLLLRSEGEPATVIRLLRALDALSEEAGSPGSLDPDSDLQAWLLRPDSFELLVEVAHDLRSPLTSILFLSEAIRDGNSGELTDLQRTQMGLIYSAALGLVSVTSNVLELARGEKGLVDDQGSGPFSPAQVIGGVVEMLGPMAESKGVELRTSVSEHERMEGHAAATSRVLLNLATNGLKFTESGFVELGATRTCRDRLEFYVRDTGRGIREDQIPELFQTFRKRPGSGGDYFFSGSGLGLSICERLLRAMGSNLEVETAPDWGTRFYFELRASSRH